MRINAFDYFRGVAIVLIVAGHSYWHWAHETILEKTLVNMITGGTALFVFISGFFFHHVFYEKFVFSKFMFKKFKYVFIPYLILTTSIILVVLLSGTDFKAFAGEKTTYETILISFKYILNGGIVVAYWYIPLAMLLFALSLVFIAFIRLKLSFQLMITGLLILISVLVHRPAYDGPIHSLVYFLPVYMIGILTSVYRNEVMQAIHNKSLYLFLAVVGLALFQAMFYENVGNFDKLNPFEYTGIDVLFIQKIVLCFFFLSFLSKFEGKEISSLKHLASMSFAIFFLHGIVHTIFYRVVPEFDAFNHLNGFVSFIVLFAIILSASILLALIIKKLLGHRSRFIIGW